MSQLQDLGRVTEVFGAAYPRWYEGEALVCRIGDTLTVQNSHENEDITESFAVPLTTGWLTRLSGTVGPHAYVMGKCEDQGRRLWLQANTEYPDRETVLNIGCARRPELQVRPPAAGKAARWDEAAKILSLHLGHQQGAVEVTVE